MAQTTAANLINLEWGSNEKSGQEFQRGQEDIHVETLDGGGKSAQDDDLKVPKVEVTPYPKENTEEEARKEPEQGTV